jgi:hypothetical protein
MLVSLMEIPKSSPCPMDARAVGNQYSHAKRESMSAAHDAREKMQRGANGKRTKITYIDREASVLV